LTCAGMSPGCWAIQARCWWMRPVMSRRGPQISTAGVARQYTGTPGRTENAQVAVYLTYAPPGGHALIDRELYLPQSWAGDRCREAGIPDDVKFAIKPRSAQAMISRALAAVVPFA